MVYFKLSLFTHINSVQCQLSYDIFIHVHTVFQYAQSLSCAIFSSSPLPLVPLHSLVIFLPCDSRSFMRDVYRSIVGVSSQQCEAAYQWLYYWKNCLSVHHQPFIFRNIFHGQLTLEKTLMMNRILLFSFSSSSFSFSTSSSSLFFFLFFFLCFFLPPLLWFMRFKIQKKTSESLLNNT